MEVKTYLGAGWVKERAPEIGEIEGIECFSIGSSLWAGRTTLVTQRASGKNISPYYPDPNSAEVYWFFSILCGLRKWYVPWYWSYLVNAIWRWSLLWNSVMECRSCVCDSSIFYCIKLCNFRKFNVYVDSAVVPNRPNVNDAKVLSVLKRCTVNVSYSEYFCSWN